MKITRNYKPHIVENALLDVGLSNDEIVERIKYALTIEDLSALSNALMEDGRFEQFSLIWYESYRDVLAESARITSLILSQIRLCESLYDLKGAVFSDIVLAAKLGHIHGMDRQTLVNAYHKRKEQLAVSELNATQLETVTA